MQSPRIDEKVKIIVELKKMGINSLTSAWFVKTQEKQDTMKQPIWSIKFSILQIKHMFWHAHSSPDSTAHVLQPNNAYCTKTHPLCLPYSQSVGKKIPIVFHSKHQ
jgi:hypothetical protein